ncbi:TetR/AcrR family transcriptional regulator [Reyranella sp.]|uniref:TetR/AcrR family transcriptional regulator n=1 Tax=Reyranella sp. TaxID=1929291 RepID=UPI003D0D4C96
MKLEPLPDLLQPAPPGTRHPKRERTRRLLIASAIEAFSARGVAETSLPDIAATADVTVGTIYNHFRSKAEIVSAVAVEIAGTIRARSAPGRAQLKTATEQMAAGCRRYLGLAETTPRWALLILDVASIDPDFRKTITGFVATELRKGLRSGEFTAGDAAAALDLVIGATMEGMRNIALGTARKGHATRVTEVILRALGVPAAEARRAASDPLPLF